MVSACEDQIQILVIGLGAVGTIYSHILEKSGNCQVTAVARSTYKTFNGPGIAIKSQKFGTVKNWKPHRVLRTLEEAQGRLYSYIVISTKVPSDPSPLVAELRPFLADDSSREAPALVLIQNGLGIEQPFRDEYPNVTIISCCTWIGAHFIVSQGAVEHGSFERIDMGAFTQEVKQTDDEKIAWLNSKRGRRDVKLVSDLAAYIRKGGGDAVEKEEIQIARWHKNMWSATVAIFCCLSRSSVASVVSEKVLDSTLPALRRTMLEILYVARNMGFDETVLPARVIDSLLKLTIKTWGTEGSVMKSKAASTLPGSANAALLPKFPEPIHHPGGIDASSLQSVGPDFRPSMLIDVEMNRPAELEAVLGSVLDRARLNGTDTPRLDLLYSLMKIRQQSALDAEAQRLESSGEATLSPRMPEPSSAASPRADKVRGRPVYTPSVEMEGRFEKSWPSLV